MIDKIIRVGDKVEIVKNYGYIPNNFKKIGRVCRVMGRGENSIIGVTFKNWGRGHSCDDTAETSFSGWNYLLSQVELTNKELTDCISEERSWEVI